MLGAPPALAQSDQEAAESQLNVLQKRMRELTHSINTEKSRRGKLQQQLRDTEISMGKLEQQIARNTRAQAVTAERMARLEAEHKALEVARADQQQQIARELKAAYQMGRQGQLKVLLNQEDPDTVARNMTYYRYFLAARNEQLDSYRATVRKIAGVLEDIEATRDQLTATGRELREQQTALAEAHRQREQAVASIAASLRDKGGQLAQMEKDQQELERVLAAIEETVVNLQLPADSKPFTAAKGRMNWPVKGKHSNRYGRPRNEGKMRWQGVTIPANEGTTVSAIHHGRVVYADWLRGSGLLLIIDHGQGYMSLYAHNQSLLADEGEWVTAGTAVSTVGSSGGRERPALYFEIRKNGKPTNPANWCKG